MSTDSFQLTTNPFSQQGRVPRFFETPELVQRYNLIKHLIQNSEQLLLVLADMGSGKTSLLKQLHTQANENWWIYQIDSTPALSSEVLLSNLLAEFKVGHEGKPSTVALENLRTHIAATRYKSQLPILLVDDAHLLPLATLKLLVELAMQGEAQTRIRVVLFCEPQITSILATPDFAIVHDSLIHTLDIPTLKKSQVKDYIQFYLKGTNYYYQNGFDDERLIDDIFEQSAGHPNEINLLAYQALQKYVGQQQTLHTTPQPDKNNLLWAGLGILGLLFAVAAWLYWTMPELFLGKQPKPIEITMPVQPLVATDSLQSHTHVIPEDTAPPIVKLSIDDNKPLTKDEQWLIQQNGEHYTLQVMGTHDPMNLSVFIQKYQLANVRMFETQYQNKAWYVLVTGVYSSRSAADQALSQLPEPLKQQSKPWVRRLSGIQTAIRR
ncbi:AAA family ATPase [Candidatus Albibeggiatoa sp. nov. NOAA]|uniref:AAA family ATPase n=1 Tax=Candidatus Albibeggiatoa sp. nov. NOAA TaxID=3162724 RepID=UPI0032F22051|nr:AAA family ATPase [Thiotrichaceae bacterium]